MPLIFAAIVPHPPLLIPTIGKDNLEKIQKTKQAMEKLEEDLYLSHPDIILIISPHGSFFKNAFTLNVNPEYETDLHEFGDLATKIKFRGEMNLSSYIRESSKERDYITSVISEKFLDHGSAVPLYYLTSHLPNIHILPVGFCDLDYRTHVDFGYMIKEDIAKSNKRIAVIASGDLSHTLITNAPAGFNPNGEKFDAKIRELLASGNTAGMLQLDSNLINDAAECGFRSFLILLGILRNVKYNYKEYSYEWPFGVGYLVANFVI